MERAKETSLSPFSPPFTYHRPPSPDPLSIDPEIWLMAEQRTQEILDTVQPNLVSDNRRKKVINYVKGLINGYFGTEVFAFGSVPLKTYLPDGDIDLISFCCPNLVEDFAREVCSLLQSDRNPEFRVPYVEYIDAQVKVVKCTVENIAVDISFNQISGICTLCFLEQVDQRIGKDHLFKRSVLLIKAWFYYESRILGAHHGLISTYALETMVLYIISLCHESVRGPLEVLYRFLEYYSQFDWDNYCLTIHGPVTLSSFAQQTNVVSAEMLEGDVKGIFLSEDFLKNCRDMFAYQIKSYEGEVPEFLVKHMNILDPLKPNNNLGRSVSKGSFNRITAALSYGLQLLQEILVQPGASMGRRLENLFWLTLERNGGGLRQDLLVPVAAFGTGKCEAFDLSADSDSYYGGLQFSQLYSNYTYWWDENTLSWTLRSNPGPQMGSEIFVPGPSFVNQSSLVLPSANFNPFREKSRGTGTYIPEARYSFQRDSYKRVNRRTPEYRRQGIWQRLDQKVELAVETEIISQSKDEKEEEEAGVEKEDVEKEEEEEEEEEEEGVEKEDVKKEADEEEEQEEKEVGKSDILDLSLEAFPLLSVTKKHASSGISRVAKKATSSGISVTSPQVEASQGSPSSFELPFQPETQLTCEAAKLFPLVSIVGTTVTDVEKQGGLLKNDEVNKEKVDDHDQLYELEDDMDFPPLSARFR